MGKVNSKLFNVAVGGVQLESYAQNASLDFTQQAPEVTCLDDAGPRRVRGNYDYTVSIDGAFDGTSGRQDATVWNCLASSSDQALAFDPTGNAAGASDPNYDSTSIILTSYSVKAAVGAGVTWSAQWAGNSSMGRAVA